MGGCKSLVLPPPLFLAFGTMRSGAAAAALSGLCLSWETMARLTKSCQLPSRYPGPSRSRYQAAGLRQAI